MNDHSSSISYNLPRLIRINISPHPEVDDGNITVGYIDPMAIESITRRTSAYSKVRDKSGMTTEWYEPFTATAIVLKGGREFISIDDPEHIARLRERAIKFQTLEEA